MNETSESSPPLPPFEQESARKKVRLAEDGWNSRDPLRVSQAYTKEGAHALLFLKIREREGRSLPERLVALD